MDGTLIAVIVIMAIICIGGPIVGHYASVASEKHEREKSDNAQK